MAVRSQQQVSARKNLSSDSITSRVSLVSAGIRNLWLGILGFYHFTQILDFKVDISYTVTTCARVC